MMMDYHSVTSCDSEELYAVFSKCKAVPSYDDSNVPLLIADLVHGIHLRNGIMSWWTKTDKGLEVFGANVCKTTYLWSTEYSVTLKGGFKAWLKVSQKKFPALKELATIFGTADVHLFMRINFDEFSQCTVTVDSPCEGFDTQLTVKRFNPHHFDLSFFESGYETYDPECSLRVRLAATDDQDKFCLLAGIRTCLKWWATTTFFSPTQIKVWLLLQTSLMCALINTSRNT